MTENTRSSVPADHPVHAVFHQLAERAMNQIDLRDEDTIGYVGNLLTCFIHCDNLYPFRDDSGRRVEYVGDILLKAGRQMSPDMRRECYRYLGDFALFNLGLFPEHLSYGRRTVSLSYYAQQGQLSYSIVAEMENSASTIVFRKLAEEFPRCVGGLHWVKRYINDPFYQYLFREFQVV